MIFNSLVFLIFFVVVIFLYWSFQPFSFRLRAQNTVLLIASYVFYGWWDWLFLFLILFSTLWNYGFALFIANRNEETDGAKSIRKTLLTIAMLGNFSFLGFFKYYNFFAKEFLNLLTTIGLSPAGSSGILIESLILPVGISFFTFQASAYTIDVYRNRIKPEKNFADFALFITFFPQLVAGPIERAEDLLPALKQERSIDALRIERALWNLLHGFFLKVVVADSLGPVVDAVFGTKQAYLAGVAMPTLGLFQVLLTGFAFMVQIYCDFAGYSFIALGAAGLLGIRLTRNFTQPFLATNPAEFWRRWHTTLMRWFTDYVYIPLGGSRVSTQMHVRNILFVFAISGLWHGANWTFILWGFLNGIYVAGYRFMPKSMITTNVNWQRYIFTVSGVVLTLLLVSFSFLFFRAYSMGQVFTMFGNAFSILPTQGIDVSSLNGYEGFVYFRTIVNLVLPVFLIDIAARYYKSDTWIVMRPFAVRILVPLYLFFMIVMNGQFGKEVIYFAF